MSDDPRRAIFDADWYLASYPDVQAAGVDPLQHYLAYGRLELRTPNPLFDPRWYLVRYPDVDATATDPALHYARDGGREGRDPHPRVSAAHYAALARDAGFGPGDNALAHWLAAGRAAGLSPVAPPTRAYRSSGEAPPACPDGVQVDVVIPVHDAPAAARRCLATVLGDAARPPGEVIVIDDASTEAATRDLLDGLAAEGRIRLLRNPVARGFVAAANQGMEAAGGHDVALLNSDTAVPLGWLARLAGHAHASARIGSVTPFSNNATICSYPAVTGPQIAWGRSLAEMDDACRAVNGGRRVDLPTGVGFCLYMRRDCLSQTGPFDVDTFGPGYGEECDWCLRAARHGWRHVLACDTFVYHQGGASFGPAASLLYPRNLKTLQTRWRHYRRLVAAHVAQDAAGPYRWAVTARLFAEAGPTLLTIGGAGLPGAGVVRLDDEGDTLAVTVPTPAGHPVARFPAETAAEVADWLRGFGINAVRRADWRAPGPAALAVAAALGLPVGTMMPATALLARIGPPRAAAEMAAPAEPVSGGTGASPSEPSQSPPRPPRRSPRRRASPPPAG